MAIVGLATASIGCTRHKADAAERPLPEVVVIEAERRDVPEKAEPNGTTRALQQVTIQARVRGFLTEIHFTEGLDCREGPAPVRHR